MNCWLLLVIVTSARGHNFENCDVAQNYLEEHCDNLLDDMDVEEESGKNVSLTASMNPSEGCIWTYEASNNDLRCCYSTYQHQCESFEHNDEKCRKKETGVIVQVDVPHIKCILELFNIGDGDAGVYTQTSYSAAGIKRTLIVKSNTVLAQTLGLTVLGLISVIALSLLGYFGFTRFQREKKYGRLEIIKALNTPDEEMLNRILSKFYMQKSDVLEAQDKDGNKILHLICFSRWNRTMTDMMTNYFYSKQPKNETSDAEKGENIGLQEMNSESKVAKLIENLAFKVGINTRNHKGETPLHVASKNEQIKVVKVLLSINGVGVDALDNENQTPLHLASLNGNLEIVKLLAENRGQSGGGTGEGAEGRGPSGGGDGGRGRGGGEGAAGRGPSEGGDGGRGRGGGEGAEGRGPSEGGDGGRGRGGGEGAEGSGPSEGVDGGRGRGGGEGVGTSRRGGEDAIEAKNTQEMTPLLCACSEGRVEVFKYLQSIGAKTNIMNKNDWNILHLLSRKTESKSANKGKVQIMKLILRKDTNPTQPENSQQDILDLLNNPTADIGKDELKAFSSGLDLVMSRQSPLEIAVKTNFTEARDHLVECGANLKTKVANEDKPLHLLLPTVLKGDIKFSRKLMENGCRIEEKIRMADDSEQTYLHLAVDRLNLNAVNQLLKLKIDPKGNNSHLMTALEFAFEKVGEIKQKETEKKDRELETLKQIINVLKNTDPDSSGDQTAKMGVKKDLENCIKNENMKLNEIRIIEEKYEEDKTTLTKQKHKINKEKKELITKLKKFGEDYPENEAEVMENADDVDIKSLRKALQKSCQSNLPLRQRVHISRILKENEKQQQNSGGE